jgi:hypothetical protein
VVQLKESKDLSFRSAALSREESVVPVLTRSRFLSDKPGFGMTSGEAFFAQTAPLRNERLN